MNSADYNRRVQAAARHQPLRSIRRDAGGSTRHKWKVIAKRVDSRSAKQFDFGINPLTGEKYFGDWVFGQPGKSAENRLYQIFVDDGCVNDQSAAIEYLVEGDPRGWEMPAKYAPFEALKGVFGADYRFVDRPLWEDAPPPFLLLTAPSTGLTEMGGFIKTPNARRPAFFKTAEAWEKDLYQASVYLTLSTYRADPASVNLRLGGARARRWRVMAGQLPTPTVGAGVSSLGIHELARIYILREPGGKPEDDEIHVQQLTYWNLMARASVNLPLLGLLASATEAIAGLDIGLLCLGLTGATVATALVGLEAAVIAIVLANFEAIIAATSGVDFWTV